MKRSLKAQECTTAEKTDLAEKASPMGYARTLRKLAKIAREVATAATKGRGNVQG